VNAEEDIDAVLENIEDAETCWDHCAVYGETNRAIVEEGCLYSWRWWVLVPVDLFLFLDSSTDGLLCPWTASSVWEHDADQTV